MNVHQSIKAIEEILGHHFFDQRLIQSAITHPSAVEGHPVSDSYERLEFLGDSIMGAIVATDLFERFPQMDEGELTRLKISLVSGPMLSEVARDLGMADLIVFGESERGTGARGMRSALENVYEAVVGALYLDAGFTKAHDFVRATLGPHITPEIAERPISYKSQLQEVTQRDVHEGPTYKIVGQSGPAHQPTFTAVVLVQGRRMGRGSGGSKKDAESAAAYDALMRLGYIDENNQGVASGSESTSLQPMTVSHYLALHQGDA